MASELVHGEAASGILFVERRRFTRTFMAFGVALAIGNAWGYAANYDAGLDLPTALFTLGGAAFVGGVFTLFAWAPGTSECKSIRVDRSGLTVGRQFLPADEVGRAALVPEYEAGRAALSCRYQGTRIRRWRMSYNYLPNSGPAVFVVQTNTDRRRPGWLIASADPEGLLAALCELGADVARPVC